MKLRAYLKSNKITAQEFADKIGVHLMTVNFWIMENPKYNTFPKPENLRSIAEATNNQVTANDFV
jgi:transcriptional regulator with XRE-family HTH domain